MKGTGGGLLLGMLGVAGLLVLAQRRSSAAPVVVLHPAPAAAPPPHVVPKPPEPKPAPAAPPVVVTPVDAAPTPVPTTMAVTVSLPLGWRRMSPAEMTPDLHDTVNQVMAQGFPVGTFAPFDLDGVHYAVLVERDETGIENVAIATEDASSSE